MIEILPYEHNFLEQVSVLVNYHIGAVIPGWALPAARIEAGMHRNPGEYVIDPWVVERKTLCALESQRVVGVAHLLRYGTGDEVGEHYRGVGDISWLLAWPEHAEAALALLNACQEQMTDWNTPHVFAWNNGLPMPLYADISDAWPHILHLFRGAGFQPSRKEALFGGRLRDTGVDAPPITGLICKRGIRSDRGIGFSAQLNGQEIGWCECLADLTEGGDLPAMRGWAELTELYVHEEWRNQFVGTWLVRHAVDWLRMAGCDRIALCVDAADEARGAGRFYQSFGWDVFTRLEVGWRWTR